MQQAIVLIAGFAAASFVVLALASVIGDLFLCRRTQLDARLAEEFAAAEDTCSRASSLFKDANTLGDQADSARAEWITRLRDFYEQSGISLTAERFWTMTMLSAMLLFCIAILLGSPVFQATVALPLGAALPALFVVFARKQRIEKLRFQLPDAFDFISRAIRSGQSLASALHLAADNCRKPLADEFAICHEQLSLGLEHERALRELARRTGVMEMQMFVVTVIVQRQTGGSPVEILQNLSAVVRERAKMSARIKSLTSEGRMQALVLLLMPPVLVAALWFLNRSQIDDLLRRPDLLAGMVVLELMGAFFIRRIVNFNY